MFVLRYVVLLYCSLSLVSSQSDCQLQVSSCKTCISYREEKCVWCTDDVMSNGASRCQSADFSNKTSGWCAAPVETNSNVKPGSTREINVAKEERIHFFPQDIHAYISPSSPVQFNVTYKLGRAYPLDVYLLVDNSYTMKERIKGTAYTPFDIIKDKIATIADDLAKFTDNVQLGAGIFMEKPVLPYAGPTALSFLHKYKLGSDVDEIKELFKNKQKDGNNEDPEAGLDALMQVMACKDEVGWRDLARRIVVLVTDATYHSAGDGKMLGIFTPCDDKCRLVDTSLGWSYHNASQVYDYPSVGIINKVAGDKKVQVLFVAPEGLRRVYQKLSNQIQGSAYTPLVGNFLSSVSQEYEKSLRHPRLVLKAPPHVKVTIEPACNEQDIQACKIDLDQNKTVQVRVELLSCPEEDKTETVEIGLLGLESKLTITVHPLCSCDCKAGTTQLSICGNYGILQCGVCECFDGWSGEFCTCQGELMDPIYLKKCKMHDAETCSGRGDCRCGECNCGKEYYGKFCEFDDQDCPLSDGKLCADNGICKRGQCSCHEGWTGKDCSCISGRDACVSPYTGQECFGNGQCVCGKCVCKDPSPNSTVSFYGPFCQSTEPKCKDLDEVVKCRFYNTSANCSEKNYQEIASVNKVEFDELEHSFILCTIPTADGGKIKYKYQELANTHADKMHVRIQDELDNPGLPVHIWAAIGSIIGMVVLVGLLTLLIWKILIDRRDAREYAQYEENLKKLNFNDDVNQLYRGPVSRFANPMHNFNE